MASAVVMVQTAVEVSAVMKGSLTTVTFIWNQFCSHYSLILYVFVKEMLLEDLILSVLGVKVMIYGR